jgi:membrane-associated phospholipid phosphatase
MASVSSRSAIGILSPTAGWQSLVFHERVILFYFVALAVLPYSRRLPGPHRALLMALPAAVYGACRLEAQASRRWTGIAREWAALGMLLPAYWALQLFAGERRTELESVWLAWDVHLLEFWGLRRAIESLGGVIPGILETCYLMLYTIPPLALAAIYRLGDRQRAGRFLSVLFLGTFTAYFLIPYLPVASPRIAFPGTDAHCYPNFARLISVWLLDHMDISTGVFPSGHVAVAFSSAFGLLNASPQRRWLWGAAFAVAFLVYLATVYGRYHYAVDGLASMVIATAAWLAVSRWGNDEA